MILCQIFYRIKFLMSLISAYLTIYRCLVHIIVFILYKKELHTDRILLDEGEKDN